MLEFKPHPIGQGQIATHSYPNGYGVSVVIGKLFYSNGVDTYEVAITYDDELCYDSGITDDVVGYIQLDEVMDIMSQVEALPPKQ